MSHHIALPDPPVRRLRGYAFDPSLSLTLDTFEVNEMEYTVPWERDLQPGPVGEYLEVIDFDPTINRRSPKEKGYEGEFYVPVNLNEPTILAENGLQPSDSNPQFHQQMVYAVAMTTIKNFERALGRKIMWSEREFNRDKPDEEIYVERLRIYPHALRQANAYYSPVKKALLFGYFKSFPVEKQLHMPESYVFTCLSHDIIAHEVTHAILDGINTYYNEPTNPDVLAFHEAFADIVALFQHFSFPEVLRHQIASTKGDLENQNLLGKLAQEFGNAIGCYGSLRDAIGGINEKTNEWERTEPDPAEYETVMEPHARGSILVAAVFDAFLNIYKRRAADLIRISTEGRGVLPEGDIHPDLVNRLAAEAAKSAGHILQMCIRAIDYCPPVDITFGEYLRAIITADLDLVNDDKHSYRLAFIEAFKKRGIYPKGIKTLSIESLTYDNSLIPGIEKLNLEWLLDYLREFSQALAFVGDRNEIYKKTNEYISGNPAYSSGNNPEDRSSGKTIGKSREGESHQELGKKKRKGLHSLVYENLSEHEPFVRITGIILNDLYKKYGISTRGGKDKEPTFKVTNLRILTRVGPRGNKINQIVLSVVQTCRLIFFEKDGKIQFKPDKKNRDDQFKFRGGATLIFDLDSKANTLKYAISKPLTVNKGQQKGKIDEKRLLSQYYFQQDFENFGVSEFEKYFGIKPGSAFGEPFSLLHNH